jgi:calcineurin-like phosphoesterase family protein
MVDRLVEIHNSIVEPEDLVYHLGDVCYHRTPEFLPQINRFNGKKILIRGNHDRVFSDEELGQYFSQITPEGEGLLIDVEGISCYATHYPHLGVKDHFNLVGHIHSAWKFQLNMMNVGVDVHHFRPVPAENIPKALNAIKNFYDDDVWVAYAECNQAYQGMRGKTGNRTTSQL